MGCNIFIVIGWGLYHKSVSICNHISSRNPLPASNGEPLCEELVKPFFDSIEIKLAKFSRERNIVFAPYFDDYYSQFLHVLKKVDRDHFSYEQLPKNIYFEKGQFIKLNGTKLAIGYEIPDTILEGFIKSGKIREHHARISKRTTVTFSESLTTISQAHLNYHIRNMYFDVVNKYLESGISILKFPQLLKIGNNEKISSYDQIYDEIFFDKSVTKREIEIYLTGLLQL